MFWSKKKKESGLPDMPQIPSPPRDEYNQYSETAEESMESADVHPLPTFPESPVQRGFSQAAIKEAVSTDESSEEATEEIQGESESSRTMEMNEEVISAPPVQEEYEEVQEIRAKPAKMKNDIYVRVDKFTLARKSLETAQAKVDEISELLKTIRETKMREEQELAYLEKELSATKARVQEITENIFEKA